LLVIEEMEFVSIILAGQITAIRVVLTTDMRAKFIILTSIILFGKIFTFVFDIQVPVSVLYKNGNIFMAQIPTDIVKIVPVFRCFDR